MTNAQVRAYFGQEHKVGTDMHFDWNLNICVDNIIAGNCLCDFQNMMKLIIIQQYIRK